MMSIADFIAQGIGPSGDIPHFINLGLSQKPGALPCEIHTELSLTIDGFIAITATELNIAISHDNEITLIEKHDSELKIDIDGVLGVIETELQFAISHDSEITITPKHDSELKIDIDGAIGVLETELSLSIEMHTEMSICSV
jgi:hypothetical protein